MDSALLKSPGAHFLKLLYLATLSRGHPQRGLRTFSASHFFILNLARNKIARVPWPLWKAENCPSTYVMG